MCFTTGRKARAAAEPWRCWTSRVPAAVIASQERTQAFKKVVQGMLQFAVCDRRGRQLMKDSVTQVIVNEEGTVHMLAREGSQIISVQEAEARWPHMDLARRTARSRRSSSPRSWVQAMVQESYVPSPEGATHYIVTELPPRRAGRASRCSRTPSLRQPVPRSSCRRGPWVPSGSRTAGRESMVIYTQEGASAAAVIQTKRQQRSPRSLRSGPSRPALG